MKKYIKKQRILSLLLALCLIFALSACGDAGKSESNDTETTYNSGKIRIATKNTPEQNILANLAQILIREKMGVESEIVYFEDSTSATLLDKMDKGNIQIFFDYSGSLAENALK